MSHRSCRIRPPHPYPCRKFSGICLFFSPHPNWYISQLQLPPLPLSSVPSADKITVADIFGDRQNIWPKKILEHWVTRQKLFVGLKYTSLSGKELMIIYKFKFLPFYQHEPKNFPHQLLNNFQGLRIHISGIIFLDSHSAMDGSENN